MTPTAGVGDLGLDIGLDTFSRDLDDDLDDDRDLDLDCEFDLTGTVSSMTRSSFLSDSLLLCFFLLCEMYTLSSSLDTNLYKVKGCRH